METPQKNPKTFLKKSIVLLILLNLFRLGKSTNPQLKGFNPQAIGTLKTDISYEYFEEDIHFESLIKILNIKNLGVRSENTQKLKKEFHVKIFF